jgi:hypothetical protein
MLDMRRLNDESCIISGISLYVDMTSLKQCKGATYLCMTVILIMTILISIKFMDDTPDLMRQHCGRRTILGKSFCMIKNVLGHGYVVD